MINYQLLTAVPIPAGIYISWKMRKNASSHVAASFPEAFFFEF